MNSIENNNNIDKNLYLYLYSKSVLKFSDDNVRPSKNHTAWGDGVRRYEPLRTRTAKNSSSNFYYSNYDE